MFKALDIHNNIEVVIIDPKWQQNIERLRAIDRQNHLVCQGCREPVRVRAGQERRHHFAHKHLLNCSYTDESATLREARAVLYEWLVTKFGECVSIEHKLEDDILFRPVDCWVDQGDKVFAYWIFDSSLNPEKRAQIKSCLLNQHVEINYVFSSEMLRKDSNHPGCIHLSTTEREFLQQSSYGGIGKFFLSAGKSIHYLDTDQRKIITFRSLNITHPPQLFKGTEISSDLTEVLVSPKNGEFVHPGEHERLMEYKQEQVALDRQIREKREQKSIIMPPFHPPSNHRAAPSRTGTLPDTAGKEFFLSHPQEKEGVCVFCGVTTADWWFHDGNTGQCKCKRCMREGKF